MVLAADGSKTTPSTTKLIPAALQMQKCSGEDLVSLQQQCSVPPVLLLNSIEAQVTTHASVVVKASKRSRM